MEVHSCNVLCGLIGLLSFVFSMHRPASTAPPMTDCGAWTPPAGNDQLQILRILDCGDETLVIIRIHFDRELQRALAPPVAAAFEITHFASGAFIQFTMNIETAHTGVCA